MGQAVAIDIGTSGIRGQILNLPSGEIIRTCICSHNPIPGANVMDHLSFSINQGTELAHSLLLDAVREIVRRLRPDDLIRLSVCGNPIQLSLFAGWEIRDLAYAGKNKLRDEDVGDVDRSGRTLHGDEIGLSADIEVLIPPAIRHEIGADALAMMLESGFLDDDMCLVTDYGTNAEMALKVGNEVYTGSAAAGPALEGQQISSGMLAGPGALSDLVRTPRGWESKVLNGTLDTCDGPLINLRSNICSRQGMMPDGITGTGVVALVYAGLQDEAIELPALKHGSIQIGRRVSFTEKDLSEAGKALGAIRAGQMTLMNAAGVSPDEVETAYMAGASGTYVDPMKAQSIGIVPPKAKKIVQVGNTSIELAKKLAVDPDLMNDLNAMRSKLLSEHIMFASSEVFSDLYVYELGYWTQGLPKERYTRRLARYGLEGYLDPVGAPVVERRVVRDIKDVGESMEMYDCDTTMTASWRCSGCRACVRGCPEKALRLEDGTFTINTGRCLGTACGRCEENCPEHVFDRSVLSVSRRPRASSTNPSNLESIHLRQSSRFFLARLQTSSSLNTTVLLPKRRSYNE